MTGLSGYCNTLFQTVLEPFEESQGGVGESDRFPSFKQLPPDELVKLYNQMEGKAVVRRRLSRRNSKNETGKLWPRKSRKNSTESSTATATQANRLSTLPVGSTHSLATMDSNDDNDGPLTRSSSQESVALGSLARSIIPDPLGELPAWFKRETEMAAANISTFRIRYPIHNPNGPRWYRNHHLLPPSNLKPPPTLFSPSFPAMSASAYSLSDRSEDATRLPVPSRSPSGTPLPTPSSSQVRIPDPSGKPRSRRPSQDNVDLMDVSDPWGTHWHHQSPYDAGSSVSPVSTDSPEGVPRPRSRISSMTTGQTRRKTVTPSPLSQSTSAVHLQAPEPAQVTRKLSKRRKSVLGGLFADHEKSAAESGEAHPSNGLSSGVSKRSSIVPISRIHTNFGASKRHSILSPMSVHANASTTALSTYSSSRNEKRQSVLGRLIKKFSILRRSTQDLSTTINENPESDSSAGVAFSVVDEQRSRHSFVSQRQSSPEKPVTEKKLSDLSKRIPPPRIDLDIEQEATGGPSVEIERMSSDRASSISYEVPFSPFGKLTIANPDAPSSGGTTPVKPNDPLPQDVLSEPQTESRLPSNALDLHSADAQSGGSLASPPPSGSRASPVLGLLSPITVAGPTVSLPSIPQFIPTARIPVAFTSSPPSSRSVPSPSPSPPPLLPPPSLHLSTSAPAQSSMRPIGDPLSNVSLLSTEDALRPTPPHLVVNSSDSPALSRSSLLANPPTPCETVKPHYKLPVSQRVSADHCRERESRRDMSPVQPISSMRLVDSKPLSPTKQVDTKPLDGEVRLGRSNSTSSRKTETYKLVRTHSDKVSSSPNAINAEGEQWLVINSVDVPRRRKTKERGEKPEKFSAKASRERDRDRERDYDRDREKERARDRDREREKERERERENGRGRDRDEEHEHENRRRRRSKVQQDVARDHPRAAGHTRARSPLVEKPESGSISGRPYRARSLDASQQRPTLVQPMILTLHDEPPRRQSDDRPRDSIHQSHAKPVRPSPSPIVTVARVNRLPSMSARPTSELTPAADINALKAREAWEMDRLWKGRSMVQDQQEINVLGSPSSAAVSKPAVNESARDTLSITSIAHGSSHTSYVVQPLQAHPIPASVFYANMPSAPPPIIYAAASPYGQPHPSSSKDYAAYRSLSNSFIFPSKDVSVDPARSNPLPAPPRESSYRPARLPGMADRNSGSAMEYWTKYTNMPSHS